jgi:hypothetical protein
VRNGNADAVLVASLSSLSPDKIHQELMVADLRAAGVTVIATDEDDLEVLRTAGDDHARMVVRDVVAKLDEYRRAFGLSSDTEPTVVPSRTNTDTGQERKAVVVELIVPTGSD